MEETVMVTVPIWPYDPTRGVVSWHDADEKIHIDWREDGQAVTIFGNRNGLHALARELLTLAQEPVPTGSEIYLMSKGQAPTLAPGSAALRVILAE